MACRLAEDRPARRPSRRPSGCPSRCPAIDSPAIDKTPISQGLKLGFFMGTDKTAIWLRSEKEARNSRACDGSGRGFQEQSTASDLRGQRA